MANYTIESLLEADGTWAAFEENWQAQCAAVGESFADYAPDSLGVLREIVSDPGEHSHNPRSVTVAGGLREVATEHFHAACMLNLLELPGVAGMVLRVRHLIVSPLIDFGEVDPALYPDVLIGMLSAVVNLSESTLQANTIRFHLRSPGDVSFFRAFGKALDGAAIFASVQMRGAWLHVTKA